MKSKHQ